MVPICHAIIDTTVNLSQEKTWKNLSWLIYESSLTIDASTKSNVKGSRVTFVRAVQWKQCACGFPVKEKRRSIVAVCDVTQPHSFFQIVLLVNQVQLQVIHT